MTTLSQNPPVVRYDDYDSLPEARSEIKEGARRKFLSSSK